MLWSACTNDDISIKTHILSILYIHRGTYSDCFYLVQTISQTDRIWLPATCEVKWTLICAAEADCVFASSRNNCSHFVRGLITTRVLEANAQTLIIEMTFSLGVCVFQEPAIDPEPNKPKARSPLSPSYVCSMCL